MARTKVSKLIRVKQGKSTIEFELGEEKLDITLFKQGSGQAPSSIGINKEAILVLRELLGASQIPQLVKEPKLATKLPPGTTRDPPDATEEELTEARLREGGEHPISGMA